MCKVELKKYILKFEIQEIISKSFNKNRAIKIKKQS